MLSCSPVGLIPAFLWVGLEESLKLPLHDAVRRELGWKEPCASTIDPLLLILPMLGNLCMVVVSEGAEDEGTGS